jgi:hypothetical protein
LYSTSRTKNKTLDAIVAAAKRLELLRSMETVRRRQPWFELLTTDT